jgi:4-amino-4-deoxy-L-arabinose transferase-like glycosyltransferase
MSFTKLMKTLQDSRLFFALAYGALAFAIIYVATSGGMGVTFDSERYLVTAHYLKQAEFGEAFKTAFAGSPILYPLTILLFKTVGLNEWLTAARLISILSFVVSVMVVFLLGLQIQGRATAHLSALTMLIFAPMLCTFSYCWSETLYIMLSLLFLLMLILFLKAPLRKGAGYLIGAAVFAGLGFFTRYLGFSMIVTGLLVILLLSRRGERQKRIKETLVFGGISVLPMLFNFLMYLFHLGTTVRETIPPEYSPSELVVRFFVTIYNDFLSFGLTFEKYEVFLTGLQSWEKSGSAWFWFDKVILLCLLIIFLFMLKFVLSSKSFRSLLKPPAVLFVYVAVYGIVLLGITSWMFVEQAGTRFTVPMYPFIILLFFSIIFHIHGELDLGRAKIVFSCLVILCTLLFWSIQLVSTSSIYRGVMSGSFPAMEHPGNRNRQSLKFLRENLSSDDVILTNIPYKLAFIWPRKMPYLGLHNYDPDFRVVGTKPLEPLLRKVTSDYPDHGIYLFLCSQDYPTYFFYIHNVDELDKTTEFFAWKKVIGNDYVFKLSDNPQFR